MSFVHKGDLLDSDMSGEPGYIEVIAKPAESTTGDCLSCGCPPGVHHDYCPNCPPAESASAALEGSSR